MKKSLFVILFSVFVITGCKNEPSIAPLPEVNEANCRREVIEKIEDRESREKFAGLCSRGPSVGRIRPTQKPLNWYEFNQR